MASLRWVVLSVLLGLLAASLLAASLWFSVANYVLCSILGTFIMFASCASLFYDCWCKRSTSRRELLDVEGGTGAPPSTQAPSTRVRMHYLDNLKSFLTVTVVLHHVTCCFGTGDFYIGIAAYRSSFLPFGSVILGIDQSYFMALFFFISGFFVPSSLDRKGVAGFLVDKFKRLGLPFLVFFFGAGPLLPLFIERVVIGRSGTYAYAPQAGPPWFVAWLLLFSSAYALIAWSADGEHIKLEKPTYRTLQISGFMIGILQGLIIMAIPTGTFAFMPLSIGSLPFDIVFFSAGVLAKRNSWLVEDALASELWRSVVGMCLSCSGLAVGCVISVYALTSAGRRLSNSNGVPELPIWLLPLFGLLGVACTAISFAEIALFQKYANYQSVVSKFFSDAAYTVYLIHPWVVVPVLWTYILLLDSLAGIKVEFGDNGTVSSTALGNDGWIWLGWIYVALISQLIVWPFAWAFRKLPLLNKVL